MSSTPQLPDEIIEAILLNLPPLGRSKESVRTICRVGLGNSRFSAVSRLSHIWKPHYEARWKRSDAAREQDRKESAPGDWLGMYNARIQLDCKAVHLLDAIISRIDDRRHCAVQLANECGYDVWEAIFEETTCVQFSDIQVPACHKLPIAGLTRQYWAREILGVIARCKAVKIWLPLIDGLDISFEKGLAALSAFFGADIERIFEEFDRLAADCQEYLRTRACDADSDLTETIVQICAWMRQRGFVAADHLNYHQLLNHFPHRVLFDQPVTLPISLVYVFVCVARRLGLNAQPVAFPHKVLAVVSPPEGDAIYVDVFESATRPILSYTSDLPAMLQAMGLNSDLLAEYTAPATTATMLLRAVGNIIQSLDRIVSLKEGDQMAAYAAYCAALLVTGNERIIQSLFASITEPLDCEVVVKHALRPGLPATFSHSLDSYLAAHEENERHVPKNAGRSGIKYFTGMVFLHSKYEYLGIIKGWDYDCRLGEEWISRMRVNELPRGSHQPFYASFAHDGRTRYVAEENIEPIGYPEVSKLLTLIEANRDLGRWFDGVERTESGAVRFIMNAETRELYPDDEMAGSLFLVDHQHCQ